MWSKRKFRWSECKIELRNPKVCMREMLPRLRDGATRVQGGLLLCTNKSSHTKRPYTNTKSFFTQTYAHDTQIHTCTYSNARVTQLQTKKKYHTHIFVHIHIHTGLYTYIHIHTYTHTHSLPLSPYTIKDTGGTADDIPQGHAKWWSPEAKPQRACRSAPGHSLAQPAGLAPLANWKKSLYWLSDKTLITVRMINDEWWEYNKNVHQTRLEPCHNRKTWDFNQGTLVKVSHWVDDSGDVHYDESKWWWVGAISQQSWWRSTVGNPRWVITRASRLVLGTLTRGQHRSESS